MSSDTFIAAVFFFEAPLDRPGELFLDVVNDVVSSSSTGKAVTFSCEPLKPSSQWGKWARPLPAQVVAGNKRVAVDDPRLGVLRSATKATGAISAAIDTPHRPRGPMDARWRIGYRRASAWANETTERELTVFYVGWRRELVDPAASGTLADEKTWFPPHLLRTVSRIAAERPYYGYVDNQLYDTTQGLSLYAGLRWSAMGRQFMFDHDRWMLPDTDRLSQVPRVFWGNFFGPKMCQRLTSDVIEKYARLKHPSTSGAAVSHGQIVERYPDGGQFVTLTRDVRMCPPDSPPEGHVFANMLFWHRELCKRGMMA
ncbi:MAG: hypothetical protein Q8L55_15895 [Phycisphaerales bacterium]|nr:hypothetical protein [Phycisphaerales bacterium]